MRRQTPTFLFLFLIFFSATFYLLGNAGSLGFLEKGLQPVQKSTFGFFNFFGGVGKSEELSRLKEENLNLSKKIVDQKKLESDIAAFRNQFETETIRTSDLLPSEVLGIKGFVPNITPPEYLVIDKGSADNVRKEDAVVFKDNYVGKVERVSIFQSKVLFPTNSAFSTSAKTQTGVLGVIKGQGGGEMILDNVLLSEKISVGDLVLTGPDTDLNGSGASPNLIIGKIVSIEKSELFQKARIKSLIDYSTLSRVFVFRGR
jgi:rod shape-determining protein MreC